MMIPASLPPKKKTTLANQAAAPPTYLINFFITIPHPNKQNQAKGLSVLQGKAISQQNRGAVQT
jgi:hypothetical protein